MKGYHTYKDKFIQTAIKNKYGLAVGQKQVQHVGETVEDFLARGGRIRKFGQDKLKLSKHEIITKSHHQTSTKSSSKSKSRSSKRNKV